MPADRFDSRADGTAVDTDGRYYVATKSGVQIFLPDGTYAGTIWVPQYPVSITFGGPDQRRALHGGRIIRLVDPDEGPRLPSSGGHELMRPLSACRVRRRRHHDAVAGAGCTTAASRRPHRSYRSRCVPHVPCGSWRRGQHGVRVAAQPRRGDAGVQLPASRRHSAGRRHRPSLPQHGRGDVRHSGRRGAVHDRRPDGQHQGTRRRDLPGRTLARHLQRRLDAGAVDESQRVDGRRRLRRVRSRRHARWRAPRRDPDVHDDAAGSHAPAGARCPRTRRRTCAVADGRSFAPCAGTVRLHDDLGVHRSRAGASGCLDAGTGARGRRRGLLRARRDRNPDGQRLDQRDGPGPHRRRNPDSTRRSEPVHQHRLGAARVVRDGRGEGHGGQDTVIDRRRRA